MKQLQARACIDFIKKKDTLMIKNSYAQLLILQYGGEIFSGSKNVT